ncbi:MAG: hypothetical protein KL787_08095 [Taibaiella sp.]|nr:hypothetical protein [Taibaiella sp.]
MNNSNFFVMVMANIVNDYVANATTIADEDMTIDGIAPDTGDAIHQTCQPGWLLQDFLSRQLRGQDKTDQKQPEYQYKISLPPGHLV